MRVTNIVKVRGTAAYKKNISLVDVIVGSCLIKG